MADDFGIAAIEGLSEEAAARQLAADGPNELPSARPRSLWVIIGGVLREPMFLLLVVGGGIYLLLGDHEEALLLLFFVMVVIGITVYQERKTENALQALRSLSSPRARVIRGGQERRIPGREVVRGDAVIIAEGDRVPADGVVLSADNLLVDESLLTGESAPVRKRAAQGPVAAARPGGEDQPLVYSSTLVVGGRGVMRVSATGAYTEVGTIGRSLTTVGAEHTRLEQQTAVLVRNMAAIGVALSALVVVIYGLTRGGWLQALLAGVALAMALLPEELPVVMTIFLALGAWRISRQQVLTRRMPAVETLGAATVLAADKTGTLTQNRMTVGRLCTPAQCLDVGHDRHLLPETFHPLVEFAILASQRDPFDPMEKAFHRLGEQYLAQTEHLHHDWRLVRQYPLSPELLAMSLVWRSAAGERYVIAAKGAPEAIVDLCHLDPAARRDVEARVERLAGAGYRVLAVARALFTIGAGLPVGQHDFDFELLGLVGLLDPVRPAVPAAVAECHQAGIRVIMITGDYPATARHISAEIGLGPGELITGQELATMSAGELQRRVRRATVFARVTPEEKLRLVHALRATGEIVAMTGDGVNDAPALKAADIGIAMGGRGTDVAREAAGLVLLDDDFASIVAAIRLGRRIFDNLRKAMAYIIAIHVPIAGLSLVPLAAGWPLILMPAHIVFMELIIDPASSTVFEAEPAEGDVMRRPPRDPRESIFDRRAVVLSVSQGLSVLAITLAVFIAAGRLGLGAAGARTITFTTLIIANLALILANVSWSRSLVATLRSPNRALRWVVGGAFLLLGLVLYVPLLNRLFGFRPPGLLDLGLALAAGALSVLWFEVLKLVVAGRRHTLLDEGRL